MLLFPPPLPQLFLHLKGFRPSDHTTSSVRLCWSLMDSFVPPTATAHGSLAGKLTERSPSVSSAKAPQSPLATKTVICSTCVSCCMLLSRARTSSDEISPSSMPRLTLTTLPALALRVLSSIMCCSSSFTCVQVSLSALPSVWYTLIEAAGASPAAICMSSVDSPCASDGPPSTLTKERCPLKLIQPR